MANMSYMFHQNKKETGKFKLDYSVTTGGRGGSEEEKVETKQMGLKVWDLFFFFFLNLFFFAKVVKHLAKKRGTV